MLISPIGLVEPNQKQDHDISQGCPGNPYRFIHTKCPLSRFLGVCGRYVLAGSADSWLPRLFEVASEQGVAVWAVVALLRLSLFPQNILGTEICFCSPIKRANPRLTHADAVPVD